MITKDTIIEDLIDKKPKSVKYLSENGIRCIVCGEPIWGTIEEAAKEKGLNDHDLEKIIFDLNQL